MFSITEINDELKKYNMYTFYKIPPINNVTYDLSGNTLGEIKGSNYKNNTIILHLNPELDNYFIQYQKSVLWHEFTHIHDLINNQNNYYMKTISEINATMIQHRYLLSLKINSLLDNINKKIIYMNYLTTYQKVLEFYHSCSLDGFNESCKSGSPQKFNHGMNYLMYLCGGLKIVRKKKEIINNITSAYPDLYKQHISSIINNLLINNKDEIIKEYVKMELLTASIGINRIKSNN